MKENSDDSKEHLITSILLFSSLEKYGMPVISKRSTKFLDGGNGTRLKNVDVVVSWYSRHAKLRACQKTIPVET